MRITLHGSAIIAAVLLGLAPSSETPWLLFISGVVGMALSVRIRRVQP